ncbi:hypothetical protein CW362_22605 [Streptomyces populi]|uniref:Secreted protein n=1 Tax=Streptomyces populi TaxID=2058924 RepID=A0A2I0SLJ7_9ACTN|nr:hypothetical protein [Streptomyces populi]PKT70816.1 hypothetical protein CW362_22605 [Streptomyces populi]
MARPSRRRAVHNVNASLLAVTLVFPAGLTSAAVLRASGASGTSAVETTPPPSPPDIPPPASTPSGTPTPDGTTSAPSGTPTPDGGTSAPSGTSSDRENTTAPDQSSQSPGSAGTGQGDADPLAQQRKQLDDTATRLNGTKDDVPGELVPTVDELATTLEAVKAPGTSLRDRQGVIESVGHLTTALTATGDDATPPRLREELTALVKRMSSALKAGHDAQVPAEARSSDLVIMKHTTSALDMICDHRTPEELRGQLLAISEGLSDAVAGGRQTASLRGFEEQMSVAQADAAATPETSPASAAAVMPPENRNELVRIVYEQNEKLRVASDPAASSKDRAEAEKDMRDRSARINDKQEEAASAQGQPEDPLGKAAEICTNAIFASSAGNELPEELKDLVPGSWRPQGVKDFWKSKEKSNILLDVLAELRNNDSVHAPIKIAPLITELARVVPRNDLWSTIGQRASYCQSTAEYLDEDYGVSVGTWLE